MLVCQTWGSNYIDFLYDESGLPYSFIYNGTQYYYIKNLQNDVIAIADEDGDIVVEYEYDAWGYGYAYGTLWSTIGEINPIRYRSYYYDTETGFYYLQTRYYDPAIRRFINADGYVNANGDILGFNMYAYCGNNPVMGYDPTGEIVISAIIIGGFIGGVFGAANSIISQYFDNGGDWNKVNVGKVVFDGVVGAVSGALASSGISLAGSVISGGAIGAISSVASDFLFNEEIQNENGEYNWGQIALNAVNNAAMGVVSGFISGAGADYIKDGQQVTNFVLSKGVLNRTIANNTQRAIARQTSVMYHHAQQLVVSGTRYLASSAFNLIVPQIF